MSIGSSRSSGSSEEEFDAKAPLFSPDTNHHVDPYGVFTRLGLPHRPAGSTQPQDTAELSSLHGKASDTSGAAGSGRICHFHDGLGYHLVPFLLRHLQEKQDAEHRDQQARRRRRRSGSPAETETETEKPTSHWTSPCSTSSSPFHILRCLTAASPLLRTLLEAGMPQGLSLCPGGPTVRRYHAGDAVADGDDAGDDDQDRRPEALVTPDGAAMVAEELASCEGSREDAEGLLKALHTARVGRRPRGMYWTARERAAPNVLHVTAAVAPAPIPPLSSLLSNNHHDTPSTTPSSPASTAAEGGVEGRALSAIGWWVRREIGFRGTGSIKDEWTAQWRLTLTLYAPMIRFTDIDGLTVHQRRSKARMAQYEAKKQKKQNDNNSNDHQQQNNNNNSKNKEKDTKVSKTSGSGGVDPRKTVVSLHHLAALLHIGGIVADSDKGDGEISVFPFDAVETLVLQGLSFEPEAWMHLPILFRPSEELVASSHTGSGGDGGGLRLLRRLQCEGCTVQGFSNTIRQGPASITASPLMRVRRQEGTRHQATVTTATTGEEMKSGGGIGAFWSHLEVLFADHSGGEGLWMGLEQLLSPSHNDEVAEAKRAATSAGDVGLSLRSTKLNPLRVLRLSQCPLSPKRLESMLRRIAVRNQTASLYEIQLDFMKNLGHTLLTTLTVCPALCASLYRVEMPSSGVTDAEKLVLWVNSMKAHDATLNPATAHVDPARMPRRVFNYVNLRWNSGVDDRFYLACESAGIRVAEMWIAGTGGTRAMADRVAYYVSP